MSLAFPGESAEYRSARDREGRPDWDEQIDYPSPSMSHETINPRPA